MALTFFAGPGKLLYKGALLEANQENGQIIYQVTQNKLDFAQAMLGRAGSQLGGTLGRMTITPYDNWNALSVLFPTFIGASTNVGPGSGPGVIAIGTRPHNPPFGAGADVGATVWNPAGNGLSIIRCAISRHPDLHLGVGKPLFGQVEFLALPSSASMAGGAFPPNWTGAFHTVNDSNMADPGGAFSQADFVREAWVGSWGPGEGGAPIAGFGSIQAEDEWTVTCNVRYDSVPVQEQTVLLKLASVEFMAKCRPVGPLWSQIDAQVMARGLGTRFGFPGVQGADSDLLLKSTGTGRTITIENCDVQGEGYEFGGTRLTTGEIGFVTQLNPSGNNGAEPLITFSA